MELPLATILKLPDADFMVFGRWDFVHTTIGYSVRVYVLYAETPDIRAAREVSGLKSDKYLWRYTKMTEQEVEDAVTGLYDD